MQWNQPFGQVAFESVPIPNNVYYQQTTFPSRAIGEGEVTSIYIPDGSTQMYFIPTIRYDRWTPHQYNIPNVDNFHKNLNPEYWFVKSVSLPIPTGFSNQSPNLYGNYLSTQPFLPNYSANVPISQAEYYQKFHNDSATSTTDIMYFYPSLRPKRPTQNSTFVQTSKPPANYEISYDGVTKCPCKVSFRVEKEISRRCVCRGSVSSMSVDSVKSTSSQRSVKSKEIHKSTKRKGKCKKNKRQSHICKCNDDVKQTSDKLVTTYADQASGHVALEGRDTQTARGARSDVPAEVWSPARWSARASSTSASSAPEPRYSFVMSDDCACSSMTETDSQ
ncbi:uncharacterized protein LOC124534560 [Vanessa cardui]|uniref:uncharacterized protein LOC124534560 n=1 Tax=Vanessa cardui TaxID=171605 RepID=UPI001F1466D1|nr:uncharacterized protein LOC124534560 [Vanessa cardui]